MEQSATVNSYDVVVVGGGLAGLVAARDLRDAGCSTVLLEARDRLGGRTLYRRFADTGVEVEFGGTYFEPTHENMAREIARYGLALKVARPPAEYVWLIGGERRKGVPIRLDEAEDVERALVKMVDDARRLRFGVPHDQQNLADLDVAISEWVERQGVSHAVRDLFFTWCSLYMGADVKHCSILHVLHRVAGVGNSPMGLIAGLGTTFANGTRSLVDALADAVEVRFETPVTTVSQSRDGVVLSTVTGERFEASCAVIALPINVVESIDWTPELNDAKREMARVRHAGVGFKVWVLVEGLASELVAFGWDVSNLTWFASESVVDGASLIAGFGYDVPGFDVTDPAVIEAALKEYVPGLRVLAHDVHDWNGDRWSNGAWFAYRPGQSTRLMSSLAEHETRLFFAGSDIALHWPGRMEGALESGRRAARDALGSLR